MNPEQFQRLQTLFATARSLPEAERAAFVAGQTAGDDELRAELEALLGEDRAAGMLDAPAFGTRIDIGRSLDDAAADVDVAPGTMIGRYRIVREIGEGGFGRVFEAEQTEPVERRVALKVIKLGMDTRQVIARFEAERQALARLDHPHVATVLDAGATEGGRPYFVMELCPGRSITAFCDAEQLGIEPRLELFRQVCRAVEHAHRRGIIHRDLKPGNVLVEQRDGVPFARVIDFGIAKATDVEPLTRTVFTRAGQVVGTPEYMSPEQADGAGDIDTRTDVYALGVLLYELLTGSTPIERTQLHAAAFAELARMIREYDPPTPSTRLARSTETLGAVAAHRRSDARRLPARLRGELDWIVMRAIARERDRRYGSAAELERDVANHLDGRPVAAAPPSRSYQVRSFVRRHRAVVATVAMVGTALALGTVGTTVGLLQAIDEAGRADAAADEARDAERVARLRADELEAVAEFQASQLAGVIPSEMGDRLRASIITAAPAGMREETERVLDTVNFSDVARGSLRVEFLDRAVEAIETQFAEQPVVRGRLLQTIAETALELGLLDVAGTTQAGALAVLTESLGPDDPRRLDALTFQAQVVFRLGRHDEAGTIGRDAMERNQRVLGPDHIETLQSIGMYGAILRRLGRAEEAVPYYQRAYDGYERTLGPDHRTTMIGLSNLGAITRALGMKAESDAHYLELLERRRRVLGPDHPDTLLATLRVARVLREGDDPASAEPYYLAALAGFQRLNGENHPDTISAHNNLGLFYDVQGRPEDAEPHYRAALDGSTIVHGPGHRITLIYLHNYGGFLAILGRLDEAEPMLRAMMERGAETFPPDHPQMLRFRVRWARFLIQRGDEAAARPLIAGLREPVDAAFPDGDPIRDLIRQLHADHVAGAPDV